jgi:hypothetical protein
MALVRCVRFTVWRGVLKSACAQPYVMNLAKYTPATGSMDLGAAGTC